MSLAIIAEVASAVMIIFHGLALVGLLPLSANLAKGFAGLVWFTLTAGFLIGAPPSPLPPPPLNPPPPPPQ